MASDNRRPRTPQSRPQQSRPQGGGGPGPRRLGGQQQPARSAGAARRYERSQRKGSGRLGWLAVGLVVLVVAAFVVVKLTSSSPTPSTNPTDAAGRNPVLAPASLVQAATTVPASVFDAVGTDGQPAPFLLTKNQPALTVGGKVRFVYVGGEFCPYCAMYRWSMLAALGRFGTFAKVKLTTSAVTDGNIPTVSFYGATYSSKYLVFSPYEASDRNRAPLSPLPGVVAKLYQKYEAPPYGTVGNEGSVPFVDFGNRYVAEGVANAFLNSVEPALNGGGPSRAEIVSAIRAPNSSTGAALGGKVFVSQANFIAGAICTLNGNQPASVCDSSGVVAAKHALGALSPVG